MTKAMKTGRALLMAALVAASGSTWAQWQLDSEKSAVRFISIKNASVAETHSFGSMVGYVNADGAVQLMIDLASVETMIPIRNERMRELLFHTAEFPSARVTANVDPAVLDAVTGGGTVATELVLVLSLHGAERELTVPVLVIGEGDGRLQVLTPAPVLIRAEDFGLAGGVEALRKVAGLESISTAVPVTVHLVFTHPD
jgi:polyisoprenoid-binding protein YceI